MSTDPKTVATRFYDILDQHDSPRLDEVCAPDMRGHAGAGANLAEFKSHWEGFLGAFPDLRVAEVRHLVSEGDTVSAWLSYEGTHQDTFAGVPGSGRPVRFAAWDLLRVEGGRIVEITQYCDLFTIMNQSARCPPPRRPDRPPATRVAGRRPSSPGLSGDGWRPSTRGTRPQSKG